MKITKENLDGLSIQGVYELLQRAFDEPVYTKDEGQMILNEWVRLGGTLLPWMSNLKCTEMEQYIEYKILVDTATVSGAANKYSYSTEEEAIWSAKAFKENPALQSPKMTAENIAYWKSREYKIVKIVTHRQVIKTV